jgi:ParB-like chromosome segregation protein Spo0J
VEPDPHNIRTNSDKLKVEQLKESLAAALDRGEEYLNPPTVYPVGRDRYRIKFGHRRYYAALALASERPVNELSFHVVPKPQSESVLLREQLEEALHQEGLTPMDKAMAVKRYKDLTGKSVRQLAQSLEEIGLDRDEHGQKRGPWWVSFHLTLAGLHPQVQTLIAEGKLAASSAYRLHTLQPREQIDLATRIVDEGMSRRELDRLIGEDTEQASAMDPTGHGQGLSGLSEFYRQVDEGLLAESNQSRGSSRSNAGSGPDRRNSTVTNSLMIPLPAENYSNLSDDVRRKMERANSDDWARTATAEQQAVARDVIHWGRRSVGDAESMADAVWMDWSAAPEVVQGTLVFLRRLLTQQLPIPSESALASLMRIYAEELTRRLRTPVKA